MFNITAGNSYPLCRGKGNGSGRCTASGSHHITNGADGVGSSGDRGGDQGNGKSKKGINYYVKQLKCEPEI